MDDEEFEQLVRRAGATTDVRQTTLDGLVSSTREARPVGRRRMKPLVVGVAVTGALLLAAAASSSYWMKAAPFQSLEEGMYRTQHAIPVDFTMTSGQRVHCEAFLEYKNLSVAQSKEAEAYVAHHDWTGFGQSLYDNGATRTESYEAAQDRVYGLLTPVLQRDALSAVPTAVVPSRQAEAGHRAMTNGSSEICRRVKE